MSESELEFRDVSISFGDSLAADGISFEVEPGEFLAVLGPSGSGKSTLLKMIGGQLTPDSGEILIGGESIVGSPPNQIDCATVFQDYALFPHMSVVQNVEFGLRMRKWDRAKRQSRALEVLRLVDMEDFASRKVMTLSGGESQRVATARALAIRPRILLMDEPLSALDRLIRLRVQHEVSALLHDLDVTTVYVTHDQREALTMADRVAVLQGGRLEQVAAPLDLIRSPATRFVAEFLGGSGNFIRGEVADRPGSDGYLPVKTALDTLMVRSPSSKPAVGDPVSVHIRPEDLLIEPGAGPFNVQSVTYTGELAEITVETPGEGLLIAKQLGVSTLKPGDRLSLSSAPGNAVVVPDEEIK
ncbi:MAG: ABC transporter ATP-binding protein [Thermoleophilia bacterium]|nr:ABC transporter ATP-binding protein [Thermoleophilia bacterium]